MVVVGKLGLTEAGGWADAKLLEVVGVVEEEDATLGGPFVEDLPPAFLFLQRVLTTLMNWSSSIVVASPTNALA